MSILDFCKKVMLNIWTYIWWHKNLAMVLVGLEYGDVHPKIPSAHFKMLILETSAHGSCVTFSCCAFKTTQNGKTGVSFIFPFVHFSCSGPLHRTHGSPSWNQDKASCIPWQVLSQTYRLHWSQTSDTPCQPENGRLWNFLGLCLACTSSLLRFFRTETNSWNCVKIK